MTCVTRPLLMSGMRGSFANHDLAYVGGNTNSVMPEMAMARWNGGRGLVLNGTLPDRSAGRPEVMFAVRLFRVNPAGCSGRLIRPSML